VRVRCRAGLLALTVVTALGCSAQASASPQPLRVRAASLTQDALALVWHVRLDHSFSPSALKRDRRSLCLVIERASNGSVSGVLCVAPPSSHRQPQLVYMHVTARGREPGHPIAATVSRSGSSDLTARFEPASVGISYASIRWQVLSTLGPPACSPQAPNPLGCTTLFPAKPALGRLHTPRLVGCAPNGPAVVYSGPGSHRVIALTFDDGPWPDTPRFLDVLEREHVHATFFQIGEQISTYGRSVDRRMLADGDMIGDHTWSHATVSGDGPFAAGEISQAADAIRGATGGFTPCLFRAPGGAVSSALISEARSMGFTTIQWDIDPRDWARPGTGAIYSNVVGHAHNGAIVIQHDGGGDRSETLAALPHEIDTLRHDGYQFVTVAELLGQRLVYR
jgi:peptidoglycan-N-acetylglucosamine deacetylase